MLHALLCGLIFLIVTSAPARAAAGTCDTALLLAIDVSNSVDSAEYRLQIDGLADALRDPEIGAALVRGRVAVAVMQWSGRDRQRVPVSWQVMGHPTDPLLLSAKVRGLPRDFVRSGTAPGDALRRGLAILGDAPLCGRHVIDVSGDGVRNEGSSVSAARDAAASAEVIVNAIAIETQGHEVADFFLSELVTPGGFVLQARGHRDYPRAIRAKLLRELAAPVG